MTELACGDVKIVIPISLTYMDSGGAAIPAYKIWFSVRHTESKYVLVPIDGFTPTLAQEAIRAVAQPILDQLTATP